MGGAVDDAPLVLVRPANLCRMQGMTNNGSPADRKCFVIAPIGEVESDTRRRSDVLLRHLIEPAAVQCGYSVLRADQIGDPGIITNQIIQHLIDDPLVIADLSERNPNVFYELAIRHVLRKPLVQIIRRGESVPFDLAAMRIIQVDHQDLDSVADAREQIVAQIRAIESNPSKVESPVSAAVDLGALQRSDRPEAQVLADISKTLTELRSEVSMLARAPERHMVIVGEAGVGKTTFASNLLGLAPDEEFVELKSGDVIKRTRTKKNIWKILPPEEPCPCGSNKIFKECHGAAT